MVIVNSLTQGNDSIVKSSWQPRWIINTPSGSEIGIAIDDHCFVVLPPEGNGQWRSIKHIPEVVAQQIGKLVSQGVLGH